jgi:recombination protein RecT
MNDNRTQNLPAVINYLKSPAVLNGIKAGCSRHITPERLVRVALMTVTKNPKLALCTKESLYGALVECGQLGLEPGLLGMAYLVPYWNNRARRYEVVFQPGYRGLIDLARRSGQISNISAHVVYERDEFSYTVGEKPVHRPFLGTGDRGPLQLAWAIAHFKDGAWQEEVMVRQDIEAVMAQTSSKDKQGNIVGPWVDHPAEMWRKTVVKRLCKYLPLTTELAQALEGEAARDMGIETVTIDPMPQNDALRPDVPQEATQPETHVTPQAQHDEAPGAGSYNGVGGYYGNPPIEPQVVPPDATAANSTTAAQEKLRQQLAERRQAEMHTELDRPPIEPEPEPEPAPPAPPKEPAPIIYPPKPEPAAETGPAAAPQEAAPQPQQAPQAPQEAAQPTGTAGPGVYGELELPLTFAANTALSMEPDIWNKGKRMKAAGYKPFIEDVHARGFFRHLPQETFDKYWRKWTRHYNHEKDPFPAGNSPKGEPELKQEPFNGGGTQAPQGDQPQGDPMNTATIKKLDRMRQYFGNRTLVQALRKEGWPDNWLPAPDQPAGDMERLWNLCEEIDNAIE